MRLVHGRIFKEVVAPQNNEAFRINWQSQYRDADERRRRALDADMDAFFSSPTDILLSGLNRIYWFLYPKGFSSTVVAENLHKRFPADKPFYEYFQAYQTVHATNYKNLFRLFLLFQVVAILSAVFGPLLTDGYGWAWASGAALAALVLARGLVSVVRRKNEDSGKAVVSAATMATREVYDACDKLISQIDNEGGLPNVRAEDWGVKAKLWTRICLWLYARAEGAERFAQTQFWLTRYKLAELSRRRAFGSAMATLALAAAVLLYGALDGTRHSGLDITWPTEERCALSLFVLAFGLAFLGFYSGTDAPPTSSLDPWKRSSSFNIDKKLGQLIQRDKVTLWDNAHPYKPPAGPAPAGPAPANPTPAGLLK